MNPLGLARSRGARQRDYNYRLLGEDEEKHPHFQTLTLCYYFFRISVILLSILGTLLVASILKMAGSRSSESHLRLSNVEGFFLQDEPTTDPSSFDYVKSNFGLISRSYDSDPESGSASQKTQWERFADQINALNRDSPPGTSYRVLYLGRHGEGFHNVAEQRYGTDLWDCYWSLQDGDENGTWVDSRLTAVGISQAETAHKAWEKQIEHNIPPPQSYYVSPMNRCLATATVTFKGLKMPLTEPFQPTIKELLRETIGLHTCDKRSPKSTIEAEYPLFKIEPGFSEEDPLYDSKLRESNTARDARLLEFLRHIFATDANTFISLTAHSGAITSILEVIGHREFALATGGVIPVVVKVERVAGPAPMRKIDPWEQAPVCKVDPKVKGVVGSTVEVLAEV